MQILKQIKGVVEIDMELVAHTPPFADLWADDKSEGKEKAVAKFRLIYHLHNPHSQYATSQSMHRAKKIISDLFPFLLDWHDKQMVKDKKYQAASSYYLSSLDLIPERHLLTAAQDVIHQMAVDLVKTGADADKIDKPKLLGQMAKAQQDLDTIREIVKKKEQEAETAKGKHAIRTRENPDYIKERDIS